ncbi:hypothetical protein [Salmonella enterica]|uniref:hypothetical protein n=1 Tax=Salmonella enterica TaxID=28901 RepID=UPI000D57ED31|nr:hypothetical protein [Salmonella enterica]PVO50878.1 hypothetical protein C4743_06045 [Salmonella enterica subsp. enterica serovar Newport]
MKNLAFAEDIHYTPVRKTRDITPAQAQERILEKCKELNAIFNGFVLPYTTYSKARFSITFIDTQITKTYTTKALNDGNVRGPQIFNTQQAREEECKGLCDKHGQIFRGITYIDRNTTHIHATCPIHNEDFTRSHKTAKYDNSLMCDTCTSLLNSARSGVAYINKVKELESSYRLYLHSVEEKYVKFGVTFNVKKRFNEIQRLSKFKHELIFVHEFKKSWQAADLEYGIKTRIKGKIARKQDIPDGWTETREYSKLPEIQKMINDYIELDPQEPIYIEELTDYWGKNTITEEELDQHLAELTNLTFGDIDEELDLEPLEAL